MKRMRGPTALLDAVLFEPKFFQGIFEMSPAPEPAQKFASATPHGSRRGKSRNDATPLSTEAGVPWPPGLQECCDGVNISIFARHATRMTLLVFDDDPMSKEATRQIELHPRRHRSGDMWHVRLLGDVWGRTYALQAGGPYAPEKGHYYDMGQLLLDPYSPVIVGGQDWSDDGDCANMRCVIPDQSFDWQDDSPPRHPWGQTVIYETHVRGLTVHSSSAVDHPGTYLGVIEKIPYFKNLGVTALELMPVQAFNPRSLNRCNPFNDEPLRDYWGYNPIGLFAPMAGYVDGNEPKGILTAFKTMVRELHKAGIEVILDVVFNHTGEGGVAGHTISFRGLDNAIYYMLTADRRDYLDFTGCGNTLNCNHPVVRGMIIDCLRHWVMHLHVDGFRFDLAAVLGRGTDGNILPNPPLLEQIAEDPILRDVKLIAEAWDSAGIFQVGRFAGRRWAEWNCHFRDDVRRFWRGEAGMTGRFASRLCGSADLYEREGQSPIKSINFVTCHDGFTLIDLVSYSAKHNEANAENNRDGSDLNYSDNNGVEGPTDDPEIVAMRRRQVKNILVSLFVSRGVPMLLGGDEFCRTQRGNNNAYCQDNETSWYDWRLAEVHADLVRFSRKLIAFRRAHPVLAANHFYDATEIEWFGANNSPPDWDGLAGLLGCKIHEENNRALCLLFNATRDLHHFTLPSSPSDAWFLIVDTSREEPDDVSDMGGDIKFGSRSEISVDGRTSVILVA